MIVTHYEIKVLSVIKIYVILCCLALDIGLSYNLSIIRLVPSGSTGRTGVFLSSHRASPLLRIVQLCSVRMAGD